MAGVFACVSMLDIRVNWVYIYYMKHKCGYCGESMSICVFTGVWSCGNCGEVGPCLTGREKRRLRRRLSKLGGIDSAARVWR